MNPFRSIAAVVAITSALTACGEAPSVADDTPPMPVAVGPTPLEQLAPGQRYSGRMTVDRAFSRGADGYMLVEVEEADDAETGRMTITLDAFGADDCEALLRGDEPWEALCRHAAETGEPVVLEGPAAFYRTTVTTPDTARPAGAFASFADPRAADEGAARIHVHVLPDSGDFQMGTRPKADAEMAHSDWLASTRLTVERIDAADEEALAARQAQVSALRLECASKGCDAAR